MKKKNLTVFEIICYVVAVLFAIVAIYMVTANIKAMNEYLAAYGVSFFALGGQAVQTLLDAGGAYIAYAFFAVAAGRIYHAVAAPKCECECEEEAAEDVLELEAPVEALEAPAAEAVETAEEAEETPVEEVVEVVWAETPAAVVAEEAEAKEEVKEEVKED